MTLRDFLPDVTHIIYTHIPGSKSKLSDHTSTGWEMGFNMHPEGRQMEYLWTSWATISGERFRQPLSFAFLQMSEYDPKLQAVKVPEALDEQIKITAPREITLSPLPHTTQKQHPGCRHVGSWPNLWKKRQKKTSPILENWALLSDSKKPVLHLYSCYPRFDVRWRDKKILYTHTHTHTGILVSH